MSRTCFLAAGLVLVASLVVACGGGGSSGKRTPISGASFQELHDTLVQRLDDIGVNIGVVPPDIRDELLSTCRDLEAYADPAKVQPICTGIQEAIARSDPGRIDLVLDQLALLEPD